MSRMIPDGGSRARARSPWHFRQPAAVARRSTVRRAIAHDTHHAHDAHGHGATAPTRTLAVVESMTRDDLRAAATRVEAWHDAGLATPLLLGAREFAQSLDAFPLEFGAILADHVLVTGDNPFASLAVDPADVRRACRGPGAQPSAAPARGLPRNARPRRCALGADPAVGRAFAALVTSIARLEGADDPRRGRRGGAPAERRLGVAERRVSDVVSSRGRTTSRVGGPNAVRAVPRRRRAPRRATSTAGARSMRRRRDTARPSGLRRAAPHGLPRRSARRLRRSPSMRARPPGSPRAHATGQRLRARHRRGERRGDRSA